MEHIIYLLRSPSGKVYIGQTCKSLHERWLNHLYFWNKWIEAGRPRKTYSCKLFYAFDAYHPDLWEKTIIETVDSLQEANEREIFHISNQNAQKEGYNIKAGGDNWGIPRSEEHCRNISIAKTGKKRKPNKNPRPPHSEEARRKISLAQTGRKQSPELIAKRAAANKKPRGKYKPKITPEILKKCPHCQLETRGSLIARWHGDKCNAIRNR